MGFTCVIEEEHGATILEKTIHADAAAATNASSDKTKTADAVELRLYA